MNNPLLEAAERELARQGHALVSTDIMDRVFAALERCNHELEDKGNGRWACKRCHRTGTWQDGRIVWDGATTFFFTTGYTPDDGKMGYGDYDTLEEAISAVEHCDYWEVRNQDDEIVMTSDKYHDQTH